MASDRGTMQRGGAPAGTPDQGGWPEPTAPSGRRLPSAPRERKPALAALALLLIVGGGLGAAFLVLQSGKRVAAIEIARQVGAGQQLPLSAMQQVQVAADSGISYVPWAEASQVARFFAGTTIPPGTLLTSAMVVQASQVTDGKDVIGLALKDGQWPGGLAAGDHVAVFAVAGSSNTSAGCPGAGGAVLAGDASVLSITTATSGGLVGSSQTGAADVTIAVNPAEAGAVACNASAGNVAIAVLPAGGQQPAGPAVTVPGTGAAKKQPAGSAGQGSAGQGSGGQGGTPSASSPPASPTGHG